MRWRVTVDIDGETRLEREVDTGVRLVLGRREPADFVIPHRFLARRQLLIAVDEEGRLVLADDGSTGGNWIDGKRFARVVRPPPALVYAGQLRLLISAEPR